MSDELFKKIEIEIKRLTKLSDDKWQSVRTFDNFDTKEIHFKFLGTRVQAVPHNTDEYVDLQASRGISFTGDVNADIKTIQEHKAELNTSNIIRIKELQKLSEDRLFIVEQQQISVAELGFREPSLLESFRAMKHNVMGFDVVDVNVLIAQYLGYNVQKLDFNKVTADTKLPIDNVDLVISYHMLEHLQNPYDAIQGIYNSMKEVSYFHVEVPVETGLPKIIHGHLFTFHKDDLYKMLTEAGFKILNQVCIKDANMNDAERILAVKGWKWS